jgi:hypothetical protein
MLARGNGIVSVGFGTDCIATGSARRGIETKSVFNALIA